MNCGGAHKKVAIFFLSSSPLLLSFSLFLSGNEREKERRKKMKEKERKRKEKEKKEEKKERGRKLFSYRICVNTST